MTIDATLSPCAHHAGLGKDGWCCQCVHACAVADRKRTEEFERKLAAARDAILAAKKGAEDIQSIKWGWDGDGGSYNLAANLWDACDDALKATEP